MDPESHSERPFDEQEMLAVLKRASELQAASDTTPSGGLSLSELEGIAADLGIDPAHLHAAVAELRSPAMPPSEAFPVIRLPRGRRIRRSVPATVGDATWLDAVRQIREAFGGQGRLSEVGTAREWTSMLETASVSLRERGDATEIMVEYRYARAVVATFLLVAFYGAIGFGATIENLDWAPVLEWSLAGGGFGGLLALTRQALHLAIRRHGRKLERLAARLEEVVRSTAPVHSGSSTTDRPREATELPAATPHTALLDEAADEGARSPRATQTRSRVR